MWRPGWFVSNLFGLFLCTKIDRRWEFILEEFLVCVMVKKVLLLFLLLVVLFLKLKKSPIIFYRLRICVMLIIPSPPLCSPCLPSFLLPFPYSPPSREARAWGCGGSCRASRRSPHPSARPRRGPKICNFLQLFFQITRQNHANDFMPLFRKRNLFCMHSGTSVSLLLEFEFKPQKLLYTPSSC